MNARDATSATAPRRRIWREVTRELLRVAVPLTDDEVQSVVSPAFTRSDDWVRLRYDFMRDRDGRCQCCGRSAADGVKVNVDHILPRQTHPELALCYANLQVLCGPCNRGKGNRDHTDWRFRRPSTSAIVAAAPVVAPLCEACRVPMRLRDGSRGRFWGCPRFPACRATRPYADRPAVPHARRRKRVPPRR